MSPTCCHLSPIAPYPLSTLSDHFLHILYIHLRSCTCNYMISAELWILVEGKLECDSGENQATVREGVGFLVKRLLMFKCQSMLQSMCVVVGTALCRNCSNITSLRCIKDWVHQDCCKICYIFGTDSKRAQRSDWSKTSIYRKHSSLRVSWRHYTNHAPSIVPVVHRPPNLLGGTTQAEAVY